MAPRDERRSGYAWWMQIASRWADCDAYGHVNNSIYYSWFDTALTTMLIERGVLRSPRFRQIGLCISSSCDFLAPIAFPAVVDAGLRISRIGETSLRYELALFLAGEERPAAVGYFVHVFVDPDTRSSTPLAEEQKQAVSDLLRPVGGD